ncbi:hypothetical protein AC1031_008045 [Aphanomyces cochlioides]|nr:hypothetical protein AC1031_008045 [Aphanomyces cochlioides]
MTLMYNQHVAASDQLEAELEQQLQQAQKEADLWRRRADKYQDEVQLARGKMTALTHEFNTLQDELVVTKQTLNNIHIAKVNAENEVDQLTSQVRVMEDSIERLESQLDEVLEDKAPLACEYEDLQTEFDTACERLRTDIIIGHIILDDTPDFENNDTLYQESLLHVPERLEVEESRQLKADLVKLLAQIDQIQLDAYETTQELIEKAEQVQCAQDEATRLKSALASVQDMLSSTQERHRREMLEFQHKYDACLARLGLEYWNVCNQDDRVQVTGPTMEQLQCIMDGSRRRRGLQPIDTMQLFKTNGILCASSTDDPDSMAHDELDCRAMETIPASVDVALDYKDRPVRWSTLLPWIGVAFVYCLPSWLESFVSSAQLWACQLVA